VRVFIFFHDCGHGSFFKSHWANAVFGFICGVLTFTPYYHWRWQHAIHHGTSSHLDKRGVGDIWTMTVQEYLESTRWKRFSYRFQRNPFVLFVIAPLYIFLFRQRFAAADASPRERYSVWAMNLALLVVAILMSWAFGFWTYLLLQGVAWMVAGASGIWLFYIQHQFEDAYWERDEHWDYTAAALQGSVEPLPEGAKAVCPVTKEVLVIAQDTPHLIYKDRYYYFSKTLDSAGHDPKRRFVMDPDFYVVPGTPPLAAQAAQALPLAPAASADAPTPAPTVAPLNPGGPAGLPASSTAAP